MKFSFRPLHEDDSTSVLDLFAQLSNNFNNEIDFKDLVDDPKCHCIIIENEEKNVIGFGSLVRYSVPSKGEVGRLEDIIIDENYRGNGLGKMLIQELISIADEENISKIYLTSNPQRVAARKLYEAIGFVKGETDVFYLDMNRRV